MSPSFLVSNGDRQGGILSLILFIIFLDDLLTGLKDLGVSCHWTAVL